MKKTNKKIIKKILLVLFLLFLIALSLLISVNFLNKSFSTLKKYKLNYSESSNIDYQVCLKENDFYEKKCIEKDMKYIASLIDNIALDINFKFNADQFIMADYSYSIIGKLIISDANDENNVIFSKNYDLFKETKKSENNIKSFNINESLIINYDEYNNLANKFKSTYGVSSNARLEIHLIVNNHVSMLQNNNLKLDKIKDLVVSIPLSENSINISIDYDNLNVNDSIVYRSNKETTNYFYTGIAILMIIIHVLLIIKFVFYLFNINYKRSNYQHQLRKILKNYDRMIVEGNNQLRIEDYDIILINKFSELVDVRDNLKLPIIFNETIKDVESIFYIKEDNNLYLYILNAKELGD